MWNREREDEREEGEHGRQCSTVSVLLTTALVQRRASRRVARGGARREPVRRRRPAAAARPPARKQPCAAAARLLRAAARPAALNVIRWERWSAGLGERSSSPRPSRRRSASASVVSGTPISPARAVGVIGSTVEIRLRSASCSPLTPACCRCRETTRSAMCAAVQSRRKTDGPGALADELDLDGVVVGAEALGAAHQLAHRLRGPRRRSRTSARSTYMPTKRSASSVSSPRPNWSAYSIASSRLSSPAWIESRSTSESSNRFSAPMSRRATFAPSGSGSPVSSSHHSPRSTTFFSPSAS